MHRPLEIQVKDGIIHRCLEQEPVRVEVHEMARQLGFTMRRPRIVHPAKLGSSDHQVCDLDNEEAVEP